MPLSTIFQLYCGCQYNTILDKFHIDFGTLKIYVNNNNSDPKYITSYFTDSQYY
jgi:hypothetical protein